LATANQIELNQIILALNQIELLSFLVNRPSLVSIYYLRLRKTATVASYWWQ